MGYRGKTSEQQEARRLRADGKTLVEIADALGVAKSSVSLWVRDVPFTPSPRRTGAQQRRQPLRDRRLREIAELDLVGRHMIGTLTDKAFLAAGAALYAGEGSKGDRCLTFANTDPAMIGFFCRWLRHFFVIDEARLRVRVYLHEGLDLDRAEAQWERITGVPRRQFQSANRVPARAGIRNNRHEFGCCYVRYSSSLTHRAVMGLVRALLSSSAFPG
jgi:hypothetical protein